MTQLGSRLRRLEAKPRRRGAERSEHAERMQAALESARQHPVYGEEFCAAERALMTFLVEHGYPVDGAARRDPRRGVEELNAAMDADVDRYIELVERFNDLFFTIANGR